MKTKTFVLSPALGIIILACLASCALGDPWIGETESASPDPALPATAAEIAEPLDGEGRLTLSFNIPDYYHAAGTRAIPPATAAAKIYMTPAGQLERYYGSYPLSGSVWGIQAQQTLSLSGLPTDSSFDSLRLVLVSSGGDPLSEGIATTDTMGNVIYFTGSSTTSLTVSCVPVDAITLELGSHSLSEGLWAMSFYQVAVAAGVDYSVTIAPQYGNPDLYLFDSKGKPPAGYAYGLDYVYTNDGITFEARTLTYTPAADGTLYLGVFGGTTTASSATFYTLTVDQVPVYSQNFDSSADLASSEWVKGLNMTTGTVLVSGDPTASGRGNVLTLQDTVLSNNDPGATAYSPVIDALLYERTTTAQAPATIEYDFYLQSSSSWFVLGKTHYEAFIMNNGAGTVQVYSHYNEPNYYTTTLATGKWYHMKIRINETPGKVCYYIYDGATLVANAADWAYMQETTYDTAHLGGTSSGRLMFGSYFSSSTSGNASYGHVHFDDIVVYDAMH